MEASHPTPSRDDLIRFEGDLRTENGKAVTVGVIAKDAPIRVDKHGTLYVPFIDDRVIAFLASDDASFITATAIPISGGWGI